MIKYRAWDKKNKVMHIPESSEVELDAEGLIYYCGSFHPDFQDRFIIMQFIECKDKTKRNIYIGDILHWDDDGIILIKEKDELGFYYEMIKSFDKNVFLHDIRFYRSEENAEVIGNIYKNPEMKNKTYWTKEKLKQIK